MTGAPEFRPCLVIPVFDHGAFIRRTVTSLLPHGLTIYITDDGSGENTAGELTALAAECPAVRLNRLPANRGKGAAVIDAFYRSAKDGCTHALQIDADGQHDADDVPRFLAAGRAHPAAVIAGRPIFDRSVPRSRLYGRRFTHFWVRIETLSTAIRDSLCGYRLYPLRETLALLAGKRVSLRMDFDVDIIVRLFWRGVEVHNLDTRVTYPADGVSHFDLLRDNFRITRTHTLLVLGMLVRLPVLLLRRRKPAMTFPLATTFASDPLRGLRTGQRKGTGSSLGA